MTVGLIRSETARDLRTLTLVSEVAPAGRTGFALGAAMTTNQIAVVVTPPLLGLLHDLTGGYAAPWGLLITVICLARIGMIRTPAR